MLRAKAGEQCGGRILHRHLFLLWLAVIPVIAAVVLTVFTVVFALLRPGGVTGIKLVLRQERQGNPLLRLIDFQHIDMHNITDADNFTRIRDTVHGHMRHMNQAILMQTNIDEGSEGRNVAYRTIQFIANMQIRKLQNIGLQNRSLELITIVAQRLSV